MKRKAQPLEAGARFDRLVAVEFRRRDDRSEVYWLFRCDCGTDRVALARRVTSGKTRSCGCYRRELPGPSKRAVIGYRAALNRVEAANGKASEHPCHFCGRPARWWVYDRSDPEALTESRTSRGRPYVFTYSIDPTRYLPMCGPCRRRVGLLVQRRSDHSATPRASTHAAAAVGVVVTRQQENNGGQPGRGITGPTDQTETRQTPGP